MAITTIPNQTTKELAPGAETFNEFNFRCTQDDRTFCQLVSDEIVTRVQVDADPIDGTELLTDGALVAACGVNWACTGSWSINTGNNTVEVTGAGSISQTISVRQNRYYRLSITTADMSAGNNSFRVQIGSDTAISETALVDGSWHVYIYYEGATGSQTLTIDNAANDTDWEFDQLALVEISKVGAAIYDCDGNQVAVAPASLFDFREGAYTTDDSGKTLVTVDWGQLYGLGAITYGCFKLCLLDLTETLPNLVTCGDFDAGCVTDWRADGGWSFGGGVATFTGASSSTGLLETTLDETTDAQSCYLLEFTLSNVSEDTPGAFGITVKLGGTTIHTISALPADPTTVTVNVSGIESATLQIIGNNQSNFDLDNVVFNLDNNCNVKFCSECFDFQADHACDGNLVKVTATNSNNLLLSDNKYLDFEYSAWGGATMELLFYGHFEIESFPYLEENTFKFSNGDISAQYIDSETQKELLIQDVPPYIHQALRLMLVLDTVTIDGERVTKVPGVYAPDRAKESKLAPAIVQMKPYNQRDINKLC